MKIIVREYFKDGGSRDFTVGKETFCETVDRIRNRRNGWHLFADGLFAEVEDVFGKSVCFGVTAPSFFNN